VRHPGGPLLSPAAAAGIAGLPVWAIQALVRARVLHAVRVNGAPRISSRELAAFLRSNRPQENP
jgi:hypothetical protein